MPRTFKYDILSQIKTRWSSRALSSEKIPHDDIAALFEAARYAPSCFNEQPWLFIVADNETSLAAARLALTPSNAVWADKAPVLVIICAKKTFSMNNKDNGWHQFDAGTAWGYLTLEAERRGIIAHGMAGFDKDAARKQFDIPKEYDIIAMAALGRPGDKKELPMELQEREEPGTRKELDEIVHYGVFRK